VNISWFSAKTHTQSDFYITYYEKLIQYHQTSLVYNSMCHHSSCNIINIRFRCYSNFELKVIRKPEGHVSKTNLIRGYEQRRNTHMYDCSNLNHCGAT
jgi:hypothetical protein